LKEIIIPKVDINTEKVLINKWVVHNFDRVEKMALIAVIETSKTALDIVAPASGYVIAGSPAGSFVAIDQPLGYIFDTLEEGKKYLARLQQEKKKKRIKKTLNVKATKKALERAAEFDIPLKEITKKGLITEKDVLNHLKKTALPVKVHVPPLKRDTKSASKRVILICGGRAATQVIEILSHDEQKQPVGILDDTPEKWGTTVNGIPVCGPIALLKKLFEEETFDTAVIAISTSVAARERFRTICADYGIPLSNAIHPTASLSSSVTMGSGNVVCAFCHFGNNTMVGDNNFISAYNSYDHHNCVGNNISTGPGCMVSGSVTIDDNVRMGAGIFIEPLVHIGRNVGIASGSIITASIDPDHVVKRKASGIIVPKNEE
jgi:sugar O-acyltransferase (sialic acid O-acetyltransferase NeuD family)